MRRLGDVASRSGAVAVVDCHGEPPSLDAAVYDADMERIGTVVDVVGPVEDPFAVVHERGAVASGARLYLR